MHHDQRKNTLIENLACWFTLTLAALTLFSAPLVATGDPLPADTFYVAPDGDDNNPGTLEFSFAVARGGPPESP